MLFAIGGRGRKIKLSRRKLLSLHKEPLVTLSSNWSSDEELYVKGKLEQGGHMNVQIDQCVIESSLDLMLKLCVWLSESPPYTLDKRWTENRR